MELRQMAVAFLFRGHKVLMMKKTKSRLYDFEFWAGIGGHLEEAELHHPKAACLREIHEETGIQEDQIIDLELRYVLLRIKEGEIRQQFVYFGKTSCEQLRASDEGELYWVDREKSMGLHMSQIVKFMMEDYLSNPDRQGIRVGTISVNTNQAPIIQWSDLKDPLVF